MEAHRLLEGLEDESGVADHLRSIDRLMDDTLAEVEQRMEHGCNGITGIPTGFDALDHVTAGWQRGDLNILAARPSVGKTAFALHLARAAAMAGVMRWSSASKCKASADRWLLVHGGGGTRNTCVAASSHLATQVHGEASAELSRLPIPIDDHPMTSMDRVRSSARLLKSKNRCDMVIVDHLQLCDMRRGADLCCRCLCVNL
ncbi:MAG: DnaB-like helicase C-terminal domain-containing protein, partial [Bacteroides uniformis]